MLSASNSAFWKVTVVFESVAVVSGPVVGKGLDLAGPCSSVRPAPSPSSKMTAASYRRRAPGSAACAMSVPRGDESALQLCKRNVRISACPVTTRWEVEIA